MKFDLSILIDKVSISTKVGRKDIIGRSRIAHIVNARYKVVTTAYDGLGMSVGEVAKGLNLDRATIYHALEREGVDISIKHFRLNHGDYVNLIRQMKEAIETVDRYGTVEGHRIKIEVSDTLIMEFHGPMIQQVVSQKGTPLDMKESER